MKRLLCILSAWLFLCGHAVAQLSGGGLMFPDPGTPHTSSSYQGPGDIVSGATAWGSCARAYSSATAAGTNMCDLVDSAAPTTVICTLQVGANGFVNLTQTNCTGSVTAATKCAAATGAVCNISKVYDQTGNGNDWTQTTAASQPILTFASVNSLPVMTFSSSRTINTAATFTTTAFSMSTVYERTSGTALGGAVGSTSSWVGAGSVANNASITNGGATVNVATATDSAYHGLNATFSASASSNALNIDGTDNTGLAGGTTGFSAAGLRFGRAGSNELLGNVAEGGFWSSTSFNATQRGNLYTNMHGANGYNGAF